MSINQSKNYFKKILKKNFPRDFIRNSRQYMKKGPKDFLHFVLGKKRPELVPPERLNYTGTGDFVAIGELFLKHFQELGRIKPSSHILDVGSGVGRMARPLFYYLNDRALYHGFEIDLRGVKWCQKHYTTRRPNFQFTHADIFNSEYNPNGQIQAEDFVFPYKDNSFDFCFLTSIFTHMKPQAIENYLREIQRVLKPNGICLITWYILNIDALKLHHLPQSAYYFKHKLADYYSIDDIFHEAAIGFEEEQIENFYQQASLTIDQILYGNWCGRPNGFDGQDFIVAHKN